MDNNDTMEWESLYSLNGEHWNAQHNFEQDKDSLGEYTFQRLELLKNNINVRFLHSFLAYSLTGAEDNEANKLSDGLIL